MEVVEVTRDLETVKCTDCGGLAEYRNFYYCPVFDIFTDDAKHIVCQRVNEPRLLDDKVKELQVCETEGVC